MTTIYLADLAYLFIFIGSYERRFVKVHPVQNILMEVPSA